MALRKQLLSSKEPAGYVAPTAYTYDVACNVRTRRENHRTSRQLECISKVRRSLSEYARADARKAKDGQWRAACDVSTLHEDMQA